MILHSIVFTPSVKGITKNSFVFKLSKFKKKVNIGKVVGFWCSFVFLFLVDLLRAFFFRLLKKELFLCQRAIIVPNNEGIMLSKIAWHYESLMPGGRRTVQEF